MLDAPGLSAGVRERAREAALALGERLLHLSRDADPDDPQWTPSRSLAGSAGYALAFFSLGAALQDERFIQAGHAFMRTAARVDDVPREGLFDGISGLRAVAALASGLEPGYAGLVAQCDAFLARRPALACEKPLDFSAFDIISGACGARLARCVNGPAGADEGTAYLLWLLQEPERLACVHPVRGGEPSIDYGVAHGVAGILSTLALTLDDPEPHRMLISRAAHDLALRAEPEGGAIWWPYASTRNEAHMRMAWCYGTPGVAAALYNVGSFLNEESLVSLAVAAIEGLIHTNNADGLIDEPVLCHGTVGNALCVASVAARTGRRTHWQIAQRYVTEALAELASTAWRVYARQDDGNKYETHDFIVGTAGVVTGLLTLTGDCDPAWMRLFGLQPLR
jgi:hypothetical protein